MWCTCNLPECMPAFLLLCLYLSAAVSLWLLATHFFSVSSVLGSWKSTAQRWRQWENWTQCWSGWRGCSSPASADLMHFHFYSHRAFLCIVLELSPRHCWTCVKTFCDLSSRHGANIPIFMFWQICFCMICQMALVHFHCCCSIGLRCCIVFCISFLFK